ncbi:MBOAT family protein [Ilyomonas limi]|uniref:MBOAT family protein n=1 Tax=Ilyomonas limi TaxID=2575867 RepID=A0A4U3KX09_9BACT|nr:MBOAT family O-acyltransferase [Ilyomonas limi]TKK66950.1 MBOAT family protein [Ilyomonas limi]
MLFNSLGFLIFLPTVFLLYWFVFKKSLLTQNIFILAVSYLFYAWWDWRFLLLLILSTLLDYAFGLLLASTRHKKLYFWLSVVNNLSILGFFKYYNFFADSASELLRQMGFQTNPYFLSIALPVGISFYTFHGMSYVFDIYNGKIKPIKNFIHYAVFVCFFPLLVAGPIERASHLLPQVEKKRIFSYGQAVEGMRLMLWGFFKKVVIADTLAADVNLIFNNYKEYNGSTLLLGAIYFSIQIYCDFSGYTDIALGAAKLFGFELLTNFRFPYFSRNIAEFWRRWHISLSSWFKDYLYIPLGGSKEGKWKAVRNTFIIFLVSGFWHGANWTFIFWGLIHALLFLPLLLSNKNRNYTGHIVAADKKIPGAQELLQMLLTFSLVTIAWIFFRSPNIYDAFDYIGGIGDSFFTVPAYYNQLVYVFIFLWLDWMQRRNERCVLEFKNKYVRRFVYFVFAMLIIFHFNFINRAEFIYFQF